MLIVICIKNNIIYDNSNVMLNTNKNNIKMSIINNMSNYTYIIYYYLFKLWKISIVYLLLCNAFQNVIHHVL